MDQLAIVNCVRWHGHVLRTVDGYVLSRALEFNFGTQRKKGRLNRTWEKQVEVEGMKVDVKRGDAIFLSKWIIGINQITTRLR